MTPCKPLGKTSVVVLLSAVLLVIASCTPVSAATASAGNVVSATAATKAPLRVTTFYDDLQKKPAQVREGGVHNVKDDPALFCSAEGNTVVDRQTGKIVTCTAKDVVDDAKMNSIKTSTEAAVKLHTDRLKVEASNEGITFPTDDKLCTNFAVNDHKTQVTGTDFLLFVAGAPMDADATQAWGTWCGAEAKARPVAGAVNVVPKYITKSSAALTRLVAREILVALGFGYYTLAEHMTTAEVRGTKDVPVAKASTALTKAKAHFGCATMANMELEYTSVDQKTPLPYWRGRVMKDDLMALNQTAGYYTDMTLAAMADLGFYDVDYTKAENMPWGRNWGCNFITNKCVSNGKSVVENVFCTDKPANPPVLSCTTDRYALGVCDLKDYTADLPAPFQYFADDAKKGGAQFAMDYCPVIAATQTATLCSIGPNDKVTNFVFGDTSRCLDVDTAIQFDAKTKTNAKGVCVAVKCDDETQTYKVSFDGTKYVDCVADKTIDVPSSAANGVNTAAPSKATCPKYSEVCRTSKDDPEPGPESSSTHHSSHHSSHSSSHHDSALTVVQSVWGVTLSLAMVLFMTM